MESNAVTTFRHRRSPSSDRFLGVFSPPSSSAVISSVAGDDFSEDDVFWTGDFAEQKPQSPDPVNGKLNGNGKVFRQTDKYGILAALPEDPSVNGLKPNRSVMNRRNPIVSQSMPLKFQQSAPVNVPVFNRKQTIGRELADVDIVEDDEEEMLPPHEIVAKSSRSPHTTFSVLEGAGRTLKGRDLRLVRNAVWRKTGFLD